MVRHMKSFKHKYAKKVFRQFRKESDGSFTLGDLIIKTDLGVDDKAELAELEAAAWKYVSPKGVGVVICGKEDADRT
jgi:hypothetical protein